jgi:hypothetical protein
MDTSRKLSDVTVGELAEFFGIDVVANRRRIEASEETAAVAIELLEKVTAVAQGPVAALYLRNAQEIMEWAVDQRRLMEEDGSRALVVVYRRE